MTWDRDEHGEVVFEPVERFTVRPGIFGERSESHLLLRLELSRRSIQLQVDMDLAADLVSQLTRYLR